MPDVFVLLLGFLLGVGAACLLGLKLWDRTSKFAERKWPALDEQASELLKAALFGAVITAIVVGLVVLAYYSQEWGL